MLAKWLPSLDKRGIKKKEQVQLNDEIWIEVPVVLGTDTIQQVIESQIKLEDNVQKVKDISVEIKQMQKEILPKQVIVSGWLLYHIFYVGDDHIIHHKQYETPFRYNMEVAYAKPEYHLITNASLGTLDYQLKSMQWLEIHHVIDFFIQVAERRDGLISVGGETDYRVLNLLYEQEKMITTKHQMLFEEHVHEIESIDGEFVLKEISILNDQVFIEGHIIFDIYYTAENCRSLFQHDQVLVKTNIEIPGLVSEEHLLAHGKGQIIFLEPRLVENEEMILDIAIKFNVRIGQTKTCSILIQEGGNLIVLPKVLGEQSKHYFIEKVLTVPEEIPDIYQVKEIKNNIITHKGTVVKEHVLIEGILNQEIFYIGDDFTEYSFENRVAFDYYMPFAIASIEHEGEIMVEVSYCKGEKKGARQIMERIILKNDVFLTQSVQAEVLLKNRNR